MSWDELRHAIQARENLAAALRESSRDDRDYPAMLAAVAESRLFSVSELARLIGLSRSQTYELIARGRRDR